MVRAMIALRKKIAIVANPHYYYGKSLFRFMCHIGFRYLAYLRSEKPDRKELKRIEELRNLGSGKVALVLGNGPSLDKLNTLAAQEICQDIFVVNGYMNLEVSKKLLPTYYCLSDAMSIEKNQDNTFKLNPKMSDFISKNEITLLLPHNFQKIQGISHSKRYFFDDRERTLFSKSISPLRPRSYTSATTYKALAVACFMNYDVIYILGFDNTEFYEYSGNIENTISEDYSSYATRVSNEPYAYLGGEEEGKRLLSSHHSPFVSGMAGRMQSYAHLFGDLFLFKGHNVVNLDPLSLTDAFNKVAGHPLTTTRD